MADKGVNYEEIVKKISRIILTNQKKMIREEDLMNLCDVTINFEQVIGDVYAYLQNVGFELIKTTFQNQKYYVLIAEGKDDQITPSQYGTMALILGLSKELDENMKISDLKDIFSEVWTSDVEFLIEKDYLRKIEELDIIKVTPLAKATFFNIIGDLKLQNLIDVLNTTEDN
ncbi:MAG: hypothetical protein ACFFAS_08155 [Promethearchaeota archaeon]